MALLDEPYIRDTLAFPKNQAGVDPMTGAPTPIPQDLLAELGIQVLPKTELTASRYSSHTSNSPRSSQEARSAWHPKVPSERRKHRR